MDKLPRTLSEQTAPQYFPGMSLNDARSKLRLQKKDIRDEMKEKNQLIKNLKIAVPNRKQGLLGVFLKYLTKDHLQKCLG